MARSKNLQVLTDEIKKRHPGVVIYGIGDEAHKLNVSDHNEDDTPGVRAAQSDSDNVREHRAIDVMVGPKFSKADANALVQNLVSDAHSRERLFYIIWDGRIWSRTNNWVPRAHSGDPHRDHPHISAWYADDDNMQAWPAVHKTGSNNQEEDMGALDELVVVGTDIASLSGNYVKAGQKIPLGRFLQLTFIHSQRDFHTGLSNRDALVALTAQVTSLDAKVDGLKELLLKGDGDPDLAAFIAKVEEEANKTRAYAADLLDKDKKAEAKQAKAIGNAWLASVVEE